MLSDPRVSVRDKYYITNRIASFKPYKCRKNRHKQRKESDIARMPGRPQFTWNNLPLLVVVLWNDRAWMLSEAGYP